MIDLRMGILSRLLFILVASSASSCISYTDVGDNVRMELPAYSDNQNVFEYSGFVLLYDESKRIPSWVAYELTKEEADGQIGRSGKSFRADENAKVVQADNFDYRGSGWSRGHMAPAGDFKWDELAMWDTFYYTNCCPQDEKLNNGSWNVLENRVRNWARQFGSVYVVTGPIVGENQGGRIGAHGIVVPDAFFKAILAFSDDTYQGISFVMFNNSTTQRIQESYLSINDLEVITGIDFFPALDDSIEKRIENEVDLKFWKIK